jgi:hypothetical protein
MPSVLSVLSIFIIHKIVRSKLIISIVAVSLNYELLPSIGHECHRQTL